MRDKNLNVDKNNKKKRIGLLISIILLICVIGISYAFFQYNRVGKSTEIIAGDIYLLLNDGTADLKLDTIFPQTNEEARASDKNVFTFSISGKNTTLDKNLYYEIKLNEGTDIEGKQRFNPEHLKFDLVEVIGEVETRIVDAMSFDEFNDTRIWVNTIYSETNDDVNRTYKLRMWLSDSVIISDTLSNADYTTSEFRNSYANVKISVSGDLNEKSVPYNYMKRFGDTIVFETNQVSGDFWMEEIKAIRESITEVRFMSMDTDMIKMLYDDGAIDLTDTSKSKAGSVLALPMDTQLWIVSDGITFFPKDCSGMFLQFTNLSNIYFNNVNTKYTANMVGMFSANSSLTNLNLSSFDTRNVTNMSYMFMMCSNLRSINLDNFDTRNVTNMSYLFYGCNGLELIDIASWNVSNVTNMSQMFYNCGNGLLSLNLSNWDIRNVQFRDYMFNGCDLNSLDVSGWIFDYDNLKDVGVSEIANLNMSNCDLSQITDMSMMFYNAYKLKTINMNGCDVNNVTNMEKMFAGCLNLESIDITNWNITNLTNTMSMFNTCSNLKTIYANSDWNNGNVTKSSLMFTGCNSLVGAVPYDSTKTDITMANPTTGYFTRK